MVTSLYFLFALVTILGILSGLNSVYAQSVTQNVTGPTVKITQPPNGEQVSTESKNLAITGRSSDNSDSNCEVYVIVNNEKPYQGAHAMRDTDYSSWNYNLTPSYTEIKEGQNKVTAKISCVASPTNLTKWYSVNFTGISSANMASNVEQGTQQKDNSTNFNATKANIAPVYQELQYANSNGGTKSIEKNNDNIDSKFESMSNHSLPSYVKAQMSLSIAVNNSPIESGKTQTVRVAVYDVNTHQPIPFADVQGLIKTASGKIKQFNITSDSAGEASYSWKIGKKVAPGEVTIRFDVSSPGYQSEEGTTSFQVKGPLSRDSLDQISLFNLRSPEGNPFS